MSDKFDIVRRLNMYVLSRPNGDSNALLQGANDEIRLLRRFIAIMGETDIDRDSMLQRAQRDGGPVLAEAIQRAFDFPESSSSA